MVYLINHFKRGNIKRVLREDHINTLYDLYKQYSVNIWRSDIQNLNLNKNYRQYFIEKMCHTFKFIKYTHVSKLYKQNYKQNEKLMAHYKITAKGLRLLMELKYDLNDEDIIWLTKEVLKINGSI